MPDPRWSAPAITQKFGDIETNMSHIFQTATSAHKLGVELKSEVEEQLAIMRARIEELEAAMDELEEDRNRDFV